MVEITKSTDKIHSCWHCRHFIRPDDVMMLDGPTTSICIINRDRNLYAVNEYGEAPGDRHVKPDDSCELFEIDPPPSNGSTGR